MLHKIKKKVNGLAENLGKKQNKNSDLNTTGLVFNIQKYSIHDGPGIRTSIFFKGCPLRCNWCSNPESINSFPEIITRYSTLCTHCDTCLNICGNDAVEVKKPKQNEPVRFVNRKKCMVCKQCVENCPTGALRIMGSYQTVKEIMDTVEQDRPFYENSGGGMTLSGGEPLFQPEFTLALLRESKRRKIHTVIDTSGYAPVETWKQVIPYVDLVLYDIKHLNSREHISGTGADNRLILDNLHFIEDKVKIWFRVPLIPQFNDDPRFIKEIMALFLKTATDKLFFLPYHQWGTGKYEGLGRECTFKGGDTLDSEIYRLIEELAGHNYKSKIVIL